MLSGSYGGSLKLWDLSTAKLVKNLEGWFTSATTLAFLPDGKTALSGSSNGDISWWDIDAGEEFGNVKIQSGEVTALAVSADGRQALSGSQDTNVHLFDTGTGRVLQTFVGHSAKICSVAFSADGKSALSYSVDDEIKQWDLTTGLEENRFSNQNFEPAKVTTVSISSDGKFALTGLADRTMRLWDLGTGRELHTFVGHSEEIGLVAFSPDRKSVLSGDTGKTIKIWNLATGKATRSIPGKSGFGDGLAFSPDGKLALINNTNDQKILLMDLTTGEQLMGFPIPTSFLSISSTAFSPDGRSAVIGSYFKGIALLDLVGGKETRIFPQYTIEPGTLRFAPSGNRILFGSKDHAVKVVDLTTGEEVFNLVGHTDGVNSLALSPDGDLIFSGSSDGTVRIWAMATGKILRVSDFHSGAVTSLALSPDMKSFLAGFHSNPPLIVPTGFDFGKQELITRLRQYSDYAVSYDLDINGNVVPQPGRALIRRYSAAKRGGITFLPQGGKDLAEVWETGIGSYMVQAAWHGDLSLLTYALTLGESVNWADANGASLLMWAIYGNQPGAVKYLVSQGADIGKNGRIWIDPAKDKYYGSPLAVAAGERASFDLLKYLVETCGMDVNGRDLEASTQKNTGWTPLFWACDSGDAKKVEYLIKHGARIDDSYQGSTALVQSLSVSDNVSEEIPLLLIDRGADTGNRALLLLAAKHGFTQVFKILVESSKDWMEENSDGTNGLHFTSLGTGNIEIAHYYLDKGIHVNSQNDLGWSALHFAARQGNAELVSYLLSKGANPRLEALADDGSGPKKVTALQIALINSNQDIVELLVAAGGTE